MRLQNLFPHLSSHTLVVTGTLSLLFIACQSSEPRTLQEKLFYEEGYSYGSLAREALQNGSIDSTTSTKDFIDKWNGESEDRRPLHENSYYFKKGYQDAYHGRPSLVQFPIRTRP